MKFTKHNNPRKRRKPRKDYNERAIEAAKGAVIDAKLGYKVSPEAYKK